MSDDVTIITGGSIKLHAGATIRAPSIRLEEIQTGVLAKPEPPARCIGFARAALVAGHKVARAGWNGKGMYLELQVPDAHSKMSLPYVFMFTACKNRVPWLCSQTDLLATDWEIVS